MVHQVAQDDAGDVACGKHLGDEVYHRVNLGQGERAELGEMLGFGDGAQVVGGLEGGFSVFAVRWVHGHNCQGVSLALTKESLAYRERDSE